ncbi:MAG: CHASE3 domain-containing protein, partial [Actinomycetota bacterium]
MFSKMLSRSLTTKIVSLLSALLVLLLALNWNTYSTSESNKTATAEVEHTHTVIEHAEKALVGLLEMESGYRGFLVAGADVYVEQYDAGVDHFGAELVDLQARSVENPDQVQMWAHLAEVGAQWRTEIAEPGMALRLAVDRGEATMQDVVSYQATVAGSGLIVQIEDELHHAIEIEEELLLERADRQADATASLQGALLWGTLATVVLLAVGGGFVVRMVQADVTRQQADAEESKRLAQIVDASALGMLSTDVDGIVRYVNPELRRLLRRVESDLPGVATVDDVVGSHVDVLNPAGGSALLANVPWADTIRFGASSMELEAQELVVDGTPVGFLISWRDVTEQVLAAEREQVAFGRTREVLDVIQAKSAELTVSSETLTAISNEMAGGADETAAQAAS